MQRQSAHILELDASRRQVQTELQTLQAVRSGAAKEIGRLKREGGDAAGRVDGVAWLKERVPKLEAREKELGTELERILETLPNPPAADVPEGRDETQNQELRKIGEPKQRNFKPKEHYELGEALGLMDFEAAAKLSGSRFVVLKGALARMQRALASFMLDIHTGEF